MNDKKINKQLSEKELLNKTAELPLEMTPDRDLWTGIDKAINGQARKSVNLNQGNKVIPMAWAASVVAAVLVTWLSFSPQQATTPKLNLLTVMQQDFTEQKQAMLVSYGQPKISQLPQEMQDQLSELASARQAIEKALLDDGNNSDLLNLLRWTQKQELDLIKQLYSPKWQSI